MSAPRCDLGVIGLGVMGRSLALNFASHDLAVAAWDRDAAAVARLADEADDLPAHGVATLRELTAALRPPRAVLLLVPAGEPVDAVLDALVPALARGDVVADGGNSHYRDTERRASRLAAAGLHLLGLGISGGESGARRGPSLMPGGSAEAWARWRAPLEAVAARAGEQPCVAHLGPGGCGHYVKMVHNGIEYGLMQLIAEVYDLLRRGLGLSAAEAGEAFAGWAARGLGGYLVEITARILARRDERTGGALVDVVADAARQKGTGAWTAHEARELHVPVPTIDAGVTMRDLSGDDEGRRALAAPPGQGARRLPATPAATIPRLAGALEAGALLTFAQGFALLRRASREHAYDLDLATVAGLWRAGCIIRSPVVADVRAAFGADPELPHLLADPRLRTRLAELAPDLRETAVAAASAGLPAPALASSLAYLDAYRSERLPTSLVQAQRDYFGAHTYRRTDDDRVHHTRWEARA